MSATVNTFPPFHELTFRHWTLLIIIALHIAFFWALNSGMAPDFVARWVPPIKVVEIPEQREERNPEPRDRRKEVNIIDQPLPPVLQPPTIPGLDELPIPDGAIVLPPGGPVTSRMDEAPREPVVVQPQADPRIGLSAPAYPASSIRSGHEGTVLLSVYVLENGRVGEVRIEHSSGYERLDQAAVREARRWRFKPGMRDGVPVPMWKQVPITFQLRDEGRAPVLRF